MIVYVIYRYTWWCCVFDYSAHSWR